MKLGIAETMSMRSPVSRSRSVRTSVDVSALHRKPSPVTATGSAAAGTSWPRRAAINTSWWFSRAVGAASANSPPARSVSRSGRLHVDPSKLARPLTRQYAGSVARTTNSSVSERLTRRDRMSTSGLGTSVTPPVSLCVSISASSPAPGRRGPTNQVASTTVPAAKATAGRAMDRGWRAWPSTVRGGWAKRRRSSAAARKPAATSVSVKATRWRSAPRAATNTNSTAPGTSASPRARA